MNFQYFLLSLGNCMGSSTTTTDSTTSTSSGNQWWVIIIYVVIFAAFIYFIMIRPQRKQKKQQENTMNTLEPGDSVLTTSGFYGTIVAINGDTIIVEFGNNKNCRIPMSKNAISQVEKANAPVAAAETAEPKKRFFGKKKAEEAPAETGTAAPAEKPAEEAPTEDK